MLQEFRYAIRMLLKNPGFAAVVVLTLALGIGANTALFSVVNGVVLNPLPFDEPDQLVTLHQSKPNFDMGAIPYPNFLDLQKENSTFQSMAISRPFGFSLIGAGEPERVSARFITADFFSVLGLKPTLGRTLAHGEDEPGAAPVALISADLWQRKFGASPDVLQKTITLDDKNYAVAGVIPADFALLGRVDVYVPIGQWNNPALKSRAAALGIHGIGRLKPGVTAEQAQADLNRIMAGLANTYPDTNRGNGSRVVPLKQLLVGSISSTLFMLLGAVGFVLLIACVNVSNLLLARSTGRAREFAIRNALGASHQRLLLQVLIESMVLALAGGALGLVVASWATRLALGVLPTALPRAGEVTIDARVLCFTLAISLLTGILAGLIPALKNAKGHVSETLKEGGRGTSQGRGRAQGIMVAVEMALALVLLIGGGLMLRSLYALWKVDPGFRADNVLTFSINPPPSMNSASPAALRAFWRGLSDKLKSAPGVRQASFSWGAFPLQSEDDLYFWLDGHPKPASQSEMSMALVYIVEPSYQSLMGMPLKQGRFFNEQDDERSVPVAVIDEAFARQHFAGQDPIGRRLYVSGDEKPYQIVGVVGHVKQWSLNADQTDGLQAQLYLPFRSLSDDSLPGSARVVVRSENLSGSGGQSLFNNIRQAVQSQSNQTVVARAQTMNEVIADSLSGQRFSMVLLGAFAIVALLLASLGIYGVISYLVGQRTQELGIRMALGAQRGDVLRLVVSDGMKMVLAGIALGLGAAFALTRLLSSMLYGVTATDPATFVLIALLLSVVALVACLIPARRATKVDPLVALRYE